MMGEKTINEATQDWLEFCQNVVLTEHKAIRDKYKRTYTGGHDRIPRLCWGDDPPYLLDGYDILDRVRDWLDGQED
jgi:hypothetical protein